MRSNDKESKNPVSRGKKRRFLIIALPFILVLTALISLYLWSYHSVDLAGKLQYSGSIMQGMMRFMGWCREAASTPLCPIGKAYPYILDHAAMIALIDAVVLILLYSYYRRMGNYSGVEHGSAHWATRDELKPFRHKGNDNMPLAKDIYLAPETGAANKNVFVNAATGGGKTFRIIIPAIEASTRPGYRSSFLCTDTKGALYRDTVHLVRDIRSMPVYLLNCADPWHSDRYNPLENIHEERKNTEIAALGLAFAKNARDEEAHAGDSIWEDTFRQLMVAVWMYQYDYKVNPLTGCPESRAMWRTAELVRSLACKLRGDGDGEMCQIAEAIRQKDPLHPSVVSLDFVLSGAAETVASVVFTAGSKIQVFTYPEVESMTRCNDIPIDKIISGDDPAGVYVNYSVGSPYKVIAALFMEQFISSAYYLAEHDHGGKLPRSLKLFLDELPNICKIYSLPERLSTSRSYGIDILVSVQSMQQLERLFPKAEKTLMNNCVTHIYLGTGEQETMKQISEALGKTTTGELSYSQNIGGRGGGGTTSERNIGREIILPSEIASMPQKYAIIRMQGHQPIYAEKFVTEKEEWYKDLGGVGSPENNCTIEDDFKAKAAIQKYEYMTECKERRERPT